MNKLMIFNFLFPLLLMTGRIFGQDLMEKQEIVTRTEQPVFKGPRGDFNKFLSDSLNYPAEAYTKGIQGRVFVEFVIEKDGSVSNIKIAKGIKELNAEAIRVVNITNGLWIPGKLDGQPVRLRKILPLVFKLPERQNKPH